MFLLITLAASLGTQPHGALVCKYEPDRNHAQIVLRDDGSIRFVNEQTAEKDSVMKADIFRATNHELLYKIVMVGRTDTFTVSLETLRGTQRLSFPDGNADRVFILTCQR